MHRYTLISFFLFSLQSTCAFLPFIPTQNRRSVSASAQKVSVAESRDNGSDYAKTLPGISAPLGFWDPLQITRNSDVRLIDYMREAELHHGRMSMVSMAVLPLLDYYDESELAIDAYNMHPTHNLFSGLALALMTSYEVCRIAISYESPEIKLFRLKAHSVPGKLFNNSIPFSMDQDGYVLQTKELNNGRLAMVGSFLYIVQELITQQKVI